MFTDKKPSKRLGERLSFDNCKTEKLDCLLNCRTKYEDLKPSRT